MQISGFDVFVATVGSLAIAWMVISDKRRLARIGRELQLQAERDRKHPVWKLVQTMPTDYGDHEEIIPNDPDPTEVVRPTSIWRRIVHLLFGK